MGEGRGEERRSWVGVGGGRVALRWRGKEGRGR